MRKNENEYNRAGIEANWAEVQQGKENALKNGIWGRLGSEKVSSGCSSKWNAPKILLGGKVGGGQSLKPVNVFIAKIEWKESQYERCAQNRDYTYCGVSSTRRKVEIVVGEVRKTIKVKGINVERTVGYEV